MSIAAEQEMPVVVAQPRERVVAERWPVVAAVAETEVVMAAELLTAEVLLRRAVRAVLVEEVVVVKLLRVKVLQ